MEAGGTQTQIRFTPGPGRVHPEVLRAQARAVVHPGGELAAELLTQCESGLKAILQTAGRVLIVNASAGGLLEAVIRNLVSRRCLHLVCGAGSRLWYRTARACGRTPARLSVPPGQGIGADLLADHLRRHGPYEALFITHHEASTGVANPLQELCAVAREAGDMLICVDAIGSTGGVPVPVDDLGIDCCVTAAHACLALPPGLAFASISPRGLERAARLEARGQALDFVRLDAAAAHGRFAALPAVTLMYALAHQLVRIFEEGLPNRYRRHAEMAAAVRAWGAEHLALFAQAGFRSDTVTALDNTRGLDFAALARFLAGRGLAIAYGRGELRGRILRIVHRGEVGRPDVERLLEALTEFIRSH